MMPIPQFKVKSAPNWDEIGEYLKFKDADYVRFAEIIVDGMIQRTRNEQVTADGRPYRRIADGGLRKSYVREVEGHCKVL